MGIKNKSSLFTHNLWELKKIKNLKYNHTKLSLLNYNTIYENYTLLSGWILIPPKTQGLGASEKKNKKKYYIILQGGELTCSHFFKSSC